MNKSDSRRLVRVSVLAVTLLSLVGGCAQKESEFFTGIGEIFEAPGAISATVSGSEAGALISVTGAGTDRSATVGSAPHLFEDLEPGSYTVTITPPAGQECEPVATTVTVNVAATTQVSFECSDLPVPTGSISATVVGATAMVSYSGASNGSAQVGSSAVEFEDLEPGEYLVTVSNPAGFVCLPATVEVTVASGQAAQVTFECEAQVGSVGVTVEGATTIVSYAGPSSGSAQVGSAPVLFDDLSPGNYTLTVTVPTGFTCDPASVQATVTVGSAEQVQFICTEIPEEPEEPTIVELDLSSIPNTGGAVAAGSYMVPMLDAEDAEAGEIELYTIGTSTFWGSSPFRLGAGFSSGWGVDYSDIEVNEAIFVPTMIRVCVLNSTLDAGHPVQVNHYGAGGTPLGNLAITMSPHCIMTPIPAGATHTEIIAPNDRFFDLNGLRLWN